LINENILGRCLRRCWSSRNPRISPLARESHCPQLSLFILATPTAARRYSMLMYSNRVCFEHSRFFKVTPAPKGARLDYERFNCNNSNIRSWSWNYRGCWHQTCPPVPFGRLSTSPRFRLRDHWPHTVISCRYLSVSELGNLRACCLPWMWWLSLRPPLRNRTLIPRTRRRLGRPIPCLLADRPEPHTTRRTRSQIVLSRRNKLLSRISPGLPRLSARVGSCRLALSC